MLAQLGIQSLKKFEITISSVIVNNIYKFRNNQCRNYFVFPLFVAQSVTSYILKITFDYTASAGNKA